MWKLNCYVSTLTEVFLNQKRINVCGHPVKSALLLNIFKKNLLESKDLNEAFATLHLVTHCFIITLVRLEEWL